MQHRSTISTAVLLLAVALLLPACVTRRGPQTAEGMLVRSLTQIHDAVEPPVGAAERPALVRFKVVEAAGVGSGWEGREFELAWQPPDRLRAKFSVKGKEFQFGRDGPDLWVYSAATGFCLDGKPGLPRFISAPESVDRRRLNHLELPLSRWLLERAPRVLQVTRLPDEQLGTNLCHVLKATRRPDDELSQRVPEGEIQLWLRATDLWPQRLRYTNDHGVGVRLDFVAAGFAPPPEGGWEFQPGPDDRVETVARSHLLDCLNARWQMMNAKLPTLGPATGEHRIVATEGQGRLEIRDGTRVLFVKGTPEEMGRQQGMLLRKQVRRNTHNVLYGLGVGGSVAEGKWFFGEMERAGERLLPYMDARYLREMDALADASGLEREEIRTANLFPELFHCSGFAIYGDATHDGRLYHGRILDYFRGQGLEQNAVVVVTEPDVGNAWVNISYAGFVGSVTAMNEKHVAIGEIGGRGEGLWDGKPMAQLVREVMEKADTIDDAVAIMRRGPRTCEYYYVISDGKTRRAVSIKATPDTFDVVPAGGEHPMIPETVKDAAVVSGGNRFTELIRRIKAGYGTFDEASARELMTPPVCMKSNIHSVLFEPGTLDFWVANADARNVASKTRFTRYNLAELLGRQPRPGGIAEN
jgi:isopenicillin-N N-acyltransferase-like protein